MKMDIVAPFLPEEIIRNILIRLPVKSLIRFQCVCKHWKNLFKTPSFIQDHLHHSTHQNPSLLFQPNRDGEYISQLYSLDRDMQVLELPSIPLLDASSFRVIGSSNGLLCVEIYEACIYPHPLVLYNPSTRDALKLPCNFDDDDVIGECYSGFGFSPIDNDYRIVRIYAEYGDLTFRVEVYSLSTGSWEEEEINCMAPTRILTDAVTANGSMFWTALMFDLDDEDEVQDETGVIVSYDIASQLFDFAPIPALGENSMYQLMVYEDKLAILSHLMDADLSCMFELWVMEEHVGASPYRERRSWTKIFSSIYSAVDFLVPSIFWSGVLVYNLSEFSGLVADETKCEAETGLSTVLYLLNISTGQIEIRIARRCGDHSIFNYAESLVPVGKIPIEGPSS